MKRIANFKSHIAPWTALSMPSRRAAQPSALDGCQCLPQLVNPIVVKLLLVQPVRAQAKLQYRHAGGVILNDDRRLCPGRQSDRIALVADTIWLMVRSILTFGWK